VNLLRDLSPAIFVSLCVKTNQTDNSKNAENQVESTAGRFGINWFSAACSYAQFFFSLKEIFRLREA
jgi:hypothetical protein